MYVLYFLCCEQHEVCQISGADNCISQKNLSNYDTSTRFGTHTPQGWPCRKITRATQNFNMAANFQDGRHGPWAILKSSFFGRKCEQMVKKDHFDNKLCVLSMYYVHLILWEIFKSFDRFNMAANFKDSRHRQSCNTIFHQNGSRRCKWWFGVIFFNK